MKWRMFRKGWLTGVLTAQEASGLVRRTPDSGIDLNGKYDFSSPVNIVGQPVHYWFVRDGDILRGHEIVADGTRLPLMLKKVRY
jgi:hypothetical protein